MLLCDTQNIVGCPIYVMKRTAPLLSAFLLLLVSSRPAFGQQELIRNGGFETGNDGWSLAAQPAGALPGARINPTIPHSGSANLVMGNINGTTASPTTQVAYQNVTIPANAVSARLNYWYNIYSAGGGAFQQFAVYIATNNDLSFSALTIDARTASSSDPSQDSAHYHQVQGVELSQFAGQTVQLVFNSRMVEQGGLTFFNIDDVSILTVTTADLAPNDYFTNRIPITTAVTNTSVKNLFATKEPGEPNPNAGGHSVWWSFSPQTNGILQLNAFANFDTLLAVYTGDSVSNLTLVSATNSISSSDHVSRLKVPVVVGTEYEIVVDGAGGAAGVVNLQSLFIQDTNPPIVTILSPTPNQHVTNTTIQVRGGVVDNVGVSEVQYRLENAAGTNGYLAAALTNNTWTGTLTDLVPGTNTVRAIAYDLNGNLSASVARTFSFVFVSPFTVTINGGGTVTPNYNNQLLELGKSYTITAKPATGNVFSNWTGDVSSTSPTLTFVMQSNMTIQANFTGSPYPAGKGNYAGLFSPADAGYTNSGFFSATVTDKGKLTAKIQMMGKTYPFTGQFAVDGSLSNSVKRAKMSPLTVLLTIDFSGGDVIAGTISDGVWTSDVTANRNTFSRTNPPPYANQKFTLVFPGSDDSSSQPGGHGYGSGKIDALGNITFAGTLGDTTKINQRTFLSKEGTWPLFAMPYAGKGLIMGWLTFDTSQTSGDLGGPVDWVKLPQRGKYYTNGFDIADIATVGSFYQFSAGSPILSWTDGVIVLQEGGLTDSITNGLTIGANNKVTGTNGLVLHFISGTGLFNGSVKNPQNNNKPIPLNGAVLQKQDAGFGTFRGTTETGQVFVGPQ